MCNFKGNFGILPISIAAVIFFVMSLACASTPMAAPTQPERNVIVDINTLDGWLARYEEKVTVANGLTAEQLMEVTKLCLASGELKDLSIIHENDVLSFAILESKIVIDGVELKYKFNYSISNSGVLTMKISEVYEDVPGAFKAQMKESAADVYKRKVMDKFLQQLHDIADTVIKRSEDFV